VPLGGAWGFWGKPKVSSRIYLDFFLHYSFVDSARERLCGGE
jgi:hypothetical protein